MITVVVVTYNSAPHLPRLVDSLPDALSGVGPWRLHVVDNDSTDGTADLVERLLPDADLTRAGANLGYAAAINVTADAAPRDDHLLVLNPDVRLHPGCLAHLVTALDSGAGIAVPKLLDDDGALSPSLRREPSLARVWAEALVGGRRAARLGVSEVISDPRRYRTPGPVELGNGGRAPGLGLVPPRGRQLGRIVLPLLRGDRLLPPCPRRRLRGHVRPRGRGVPHRGAYGADVDLWRLLVGNRVRDCARRHGPARTLLFRSGLAAGEAIRSADPAHRAGPGPRSRRSPRSRLGRPRRRPPPPGVPATSGSPLRTGGTTTRALRLPARCARSPAPARPGREQHGDANASEGHQHPVRPTDPAQARQHVRSWCGARFRTCPASM